MQRLGEVLTRISKRWMPSPFIFAIVLTAVVYLMGLGMTDHGPLQLVKDWYNGFWDLLTFGMQMVLILVTGYAIASAPTVKKGLRKLASLPGSGASAVGLVAGVALVLGLINWGLGLIAGAILAREVARAGAERDVAIHYPLLAAAGYMGLLIWHGGLSGSAPLKVAEEGHFLAEQMGVIGLGQTVFRPTNLILSAALVVAVPLLLMWMHPDDEDEVQKADEEVLEEDEPETEEDGSEAGDEELPPAEKMNRSPVMAWLLIAAMAVYLGWYFVNEGALGLNLNIVNFLFLTVGLALHGTPQDYADAVVDGAKMSSGIILLFPFYAGIMGLMSNSGLVAQVARWFADISTQTTYPFFTMISAGLVNVAVPSGGGQWSVQGEIIVQAADQLSVDTGRVIMAMAYGDELTNMVQPFWALPLLGITGLRAGQVMGYTATVMIFVFVMMGGAVLFLP